MKLTRPRCLVVVALALALGLGLGLGLRKGSNSEYQHSGHNVLVIMSDDQDLHLDSMSAMPNVKRLIGEQGVTYVSLRQSVFAYADPSCLDMTNTTAQLRGAVHPESTFSPAALLTTLMSHPPEEIMEAGASSLAKA